MIPKEISKTTNSGGIRRLIEYIGRLDRDESEKVDLNFTNCLSDKTAVYEMETKQYLSRGRQNKTYHLVLSFHKEDNLTKEQYDYIEEEVCKALGYADHQRGSAIHLDTNNPHLHIAINKVHPETLRVVTPYYSYYKLNAFCRKMQVELNLKQDDLTFKKDRGVSVSDKTQKVETANKESLYSFVSENIKTKEFLENKPTTWQTLHQKLKEFNLVIKPFGRGFVIGDILKDIWIKASFLMSCKDLGEFEEFQEQVQTQNTTQQTKTNPSKSNQANQNKSNNSEDIEQPIQNHVQQKFYDGVNHKVAKSELWVDFVAHKNKILGAKQEYFTDLKDKVAYQRQVLQRRYQERRQHIKNQPYLSGSTKMKLYKELAQNRKIEAAKITALYALKRKEAYEYYKTPQWQDKLIHEAYNGNQEALKLLINSKQQKGFNALVKHLNETAHEPLSKACLDNIQAIKNAKEQFKNPVIPEIKEWIEKRNALVGKAQGVIEHKAYSNESGSFKYHGCRKIGEYQTVLLEKDNVMLVKTISEKQKGLLSSQLKVGSQISVNEKGLIQLNVSSNQVNKPNKSKFRR